MDSPTLAEIAVANIRALIKQRDDLDEAGLLRKAKVNASFFANFDAGKRNPTLGTIEKLAGPLRVPSVALLIAPGTRDLLLRILRNYGSMMPESADQLEAIASQIRLPRPSDQRSLREAEADKAQAEALPSPAPQMTKQG